MYGSVNQICEDFSVVKLLENYNTILRVATNFVYHIFLDFGFPRQCIWGFKSSEMWHPCHLVSGSWYSEGT
jgi:hypothetical protein